MKPMNIILNMIFVLLLSAIQMEAQELKPELKIFSNLSNTEWVGRFDEPGETQEINLRIETILDGTCLLETQTIPAANNFGSQKWIYWDPNGKCLAFLRLTNNGYVNRGCITPKDSLMLYEGTMLRPDGSSKKTKSERIMKQDGTMVEKSGHTIIFKKK